MATVSPHAVVVVAVAVAVVVVAVVPCVVMQQAVAVLVYTACHYLTPAPHL